DLDRFVQRLMREDFRASLRAPQGLDLDHYIDAVLERFRNPAIRHLLAQIAWDGSQKLPFRILNTIVEALEAGRPIARMCVPIAACFHFVGRKAANGDTIVNPMADALSEIGQRCTGVAAHDVSAFMNLPRFWPARLASNELVRHGLTRAYEQLATVQKPADLKLDCFL